MTKPLRESVVEQQLCTRCGCCAAVCPQGCISIDGYPVIGDDCTDCGLCTKICAGTGTDLRKTAESLFEKGSSSEYVGTFINSYVGYSRNEAVRGNATSGGVVTSLLMCLLDHNVIDGALVVSFDEKEPWKTTYVVAASQEDIKKSAQTKYQITPLKVPLKEVSLEKIAVVGLPCVIQGLRKIQTSTRWGENIKVLIGLFCWVNMEREATEFLLQKLNIDRGDVKSIEYRSGDYLGGFKVVLKNGDTKFLGKECYNVLPLLFAPERCVYCPDFTNELADISVGDAKFMHSKEGHTFIITRSEEGEKLLKTCMDKGYITIEQCDVEKIIWSESSSLLFKKGAFERMKTRGIKSYYGEETYSIPVKNRLFELILSVVHRNRRFFKKMFEIMPLPVFKIVSRLVTRERS